jgi:tRNA(Arg) A34 adenosine deaminase TadA
MANWTDDFWLGMALEICQEGSKDPSTRVGCVIVRPDKTPCSWGTNGFPQGIADTEERLNDRPTKLELTVHAEMNAFLFAPERVVGYTMYTTFAPCIRCAANIIQAKIARSRPPAITARAGREEQGGPTLCSGRLGSTCQSSKTGIRPSNWQPSVAEKLIADRDNKQGDRLT